jgi:hypothetical protein
VSGTVVVVRSRTTTESRSIDWSRLYPWQLLKQPEVLQWYGSDQFDLLLMASQGTAGHEVAGPVRRRDGVSLLVEEEAKAQFQ